MVNSEASKEYFPWVVQLRRFNAIGSKDDANGNDDNSNSESSSESEEKIKTRSYANVRGDNGNDDDSSSSSSGSLEEFELSMTSCVGSIISSRLVCISFDNEKVEYIL